MDLVVCAESIHSADTFPGADLSDGAFRASAGAGLCHRRGGGPSGSAALGTTVDHADL